MAQTEKVAGPANTKRLLSHFPTAAAGAKVMRLGRLVFVVIGSLAVASVLGALALLFELSYRPTYDQSDPNDRRYPEVFARLHQNPITEARQETITLAYQN
jgi:hypothetical protein